MYKLVIVDDEAAIRKGMCNYISWSEMGFEVVADFEDGKETIEYLNQNSVDVILTDIEMAQISGLKLAGYVKRNKLAVKVVILSGYKEFEYAREAVEYSVEYYLLKPIRMEEIRKVFGKIKEELDQSKIKTASLLSEQKKFKEMLLELQEQFWISFLAGGRGEENEILKRGQLLNLKLEPDKPCAILDVKLKENEGSYSLQYGNLNKRHLIQNIFLEDSKREDIKYYPVYLINDVIKVIAVAGYKETIKAFHERLMLRVEEKCSFVLKLLKLEVIITVDKVFLNIFEMDKYKDNFLIHLGDRPNRGTQLQHIDYERLMQKYKQLAGNINDGDFEVLQRGMEEAFHEFGNLPIEYIKQFSIGIFSMISNRFMKMGEDMWINLNEKINYHEILSLETIDELEIKCKNTLAGIMRVISQKQNDISKSVIEQAVSYMKEHYGEDLSLEYIADRFFLNQSYFSRLFKQYTGITFTDYLIQLRMEKAKELISIGKYKVYEISTIVGYKSEKYFFSVFKRYTGSSPIEYYRNRVMKDEK